MAQGAFEQIKQALCQKPILHVPNFDQTFILQIDVSAVTLGTILIQEKKGTEHPIGYTSCTFLEYEQKNFTVEWECLAIKWVVDLFLLLLAGEIICSGHGPHCAQVAPVGKDRKCTYH